MNAPKTYKNENVFDGNENETQIIKNCYRDWLTQMQSDPPNCSQQPQLNAQLNAYMDSLKTCRSNSSPALHNWPQQTKCNKLSAFALDLLSAPASQAFVEWIFSVCGLLTSWRRNRTSNSLEMRVLQKLNSRMLIDIGYK